VILTRVIISIFMFFISPIGMLVIPLSSARRAPAVLPQAGGRRGGDPGSPRSPEFPDTDPHQVLADDQFPAGPGLPAVSPSAGLCMMGHPRLWRSPDGVRAQAQFRDGLFPMGSPKGGGIVPGVSGRKIQFIPFIPGPYFPH
jgi:hypothetical protein